MLSKSESTFDKKKEKKLNLTCDNLLIVLCNEINFNLFIRLNKAISARSQSFILYSEPIYRLSKYYRDEMKSREVCYSSADMVSRDWMPVFVIRNDNSSLRYSLMKSQHQNQSRFICLTE